MIINVRRDSLEVWNELCEFADVQVKVWESSKNDEDFDEKTRNYMSGACKAWSDIQSRMRAVLASADEYDKDQLNEALDHEWLNMNQQLEADRRDLYKMIGEDK